LAQQLKAVRIYFQKAFERMLNSESLKDMRIGAVIVIPALLVFDFVHSSPNVITRAVAQALIIFIILGTFSAAVGAFVRGFLDGMKDHQSSTKNNNLAKAESNE